MSLSDDIIDAIFTTCATALIGNESLSSSGSSVRAAVVVGRHRRDRVEIRGAQLVVANVVLGDGEQQLGLLVVGRELRRRARDGDQRFEIRRRSRRGGERSCAHARATSARREAQRVERAGAARVATGGVTRVSLARTDASLDAGVIRPSDASCLRSAGANAYRRRDRIAFARGSSTASASERSFGVRRQDDAVVARRRAERGQRKRQREHAERRRRQSRAATPGVDSSRGSRIASRRPSNSLRRAIASAAAAGAPDVTERARDLQQVVRVVTRTRARVEHEVVARVLALDAHLARREPHDRIEPEHDDGNLRDELRERVESLDVRQLVQAARSCAAPPSTRRRRREAGRADRRLPTSSARTRDRSAAA